MQTRSMLALLLALPLAAPATAQDSTRFRVLSLRAHLYQQQTGTIDTMNLVDADPSLELFNTPIGAGIAGTPSGATLVLVEVSGYRVQDTTGVVSLTAKIGARTLLQRAVRLRSLFSGTGRLFVPFIVYGTGCGDLTLVANIAHGTAVDDSATKLIHFLCGE